MSFEYETKKFSVELFTKGRYGTCIKLTAKGKHKINQDDIEEFLHNESADEYFATIHIGRSEWYPPEGPDVVELYEVKQLARIAAEVEEE